MQTNKMHSACDAYRWTDFTNDVDVRKTNQGEQSITPVALWVATAGNIYVYFDETKTTAVRFTVPQNGTLLPIQPNYIAKAATGTSVTDVTAMYEDRIK